MECSAAAAPKAAPNRHVDPTLTNRFHGCRCFFVWPLSADPRHSQHNLVGIERKDSDAIERMRRSCSLASRVRAFAGSCVQVGRSTDEIDALVHAEVVRLGVYPSPLGYAHFPKSVCTSVNQVVVHGIPDGRRLLQGDIVNIDVSVYVDGFHGDCSGMFVAGEADPLAAHLLKTTRACLDGAIALCKPGVPFSAIGAFIQPMAEREGFSVVKQFCGHGIGRIFHMPPLVFHCGQRQRSGKRRARLTVRSALLSHGVRIHLSLVSAPCMLSALSSPHQ